MLVCHVTSPTITIEDDTVGVLKLRGIGGSSLGEVYLCFEMIPHVLVQLIG